MLRLFLPGWLQEVIQNYSSIDDIPEELISDTKEKLSKFRSDNPEVSIVIPVWNEENKLFSTLRTLARQKTSYRVELLIVNNNSTDRTQELLDKCGVYTIFEGRQGITRARQTGLDAAKGKYHLCGDGDSFYPPLWCESLVKELENSEIAVAHGRHSFIPPDGSGRFLLSIYELISELLFDLRRKRRPFLNVLGFNNGFRTEDARKVGGYNLNRQFWQDGWMAMQLNQFGKISLIRSANARVWTSPRRLLADGSIVKAFIRRVKKEIVRLKEYIIKTPIKYD